MSKYRLLFSIFIPSVLLLAILAPFMWWYETRIAMENAQEVLAKRIEDFSVNLSHNSTNVTRHVKTLASFLTSAERVDILSLMQKTINELPDVDGIIVAYDPEFLANVKKGKYPDFKLSAFYDNLDGNNIPDHFAPGLYRENDSKSVYRDDSVQHYDSKDWFLIPKYLRRGEWTSPYVSYDTNSILYCYGYPFYHHGDFVGVVVCQIRARNIVSVELRHEFANIGIKGGRFFVIDANGQLVYHSQLPVLSKFSLYSVVKENKREDLYPIIDTVIHNTKGRIRIPSFQLLPGGMSASSNDHTWYIYATPRSEVMWTFVGAFEERDVYGSLYHRLSWMVIEFGLIVFAFCFFVSLLVYWASRPVEAMTQVAEQVAKGDLSVRVPVAYEKRSGGTGLLVRRFNEMIARLTEQKDETIRETAKRVGFEQELSISQDLQQSFLPANRVLLDPPRGYSLCGDLIPAKYVAGDFFDFWRINAQTVGFVVADVSGKGVPAAMVMIAMNTLLRQIASKSATPGDVITEVNRILMLRNKKNMFATLFLAYYYPDTGRIVYCNAGHNPPLVACADGSIKSFDYAENMIIGVVPDMKFVSSEMVLEPGEMLLVYTDGVTDATNRQGEQFGMDRLKALLTQSVSLPFKQVFPAMIETLKEFQSDSQTDDTTMLALKRTEETCKICTIDETLMTFFGQNENVINSVLDAMRDKNWDEDDIKAVYDMLEESFAYCDWCNEGELCRQIHFTCSVSETLISMTLGNDGNGWHESYGSESDREKEAAIRAIELLEYISSVMTSAWFNHAGTTILMEKYR